MKLSKEAIEEFKQIYRKELGEEISDGEAHELGLKLLQLFKVIYKPIPKSHQCGLCKPHGKKNGVS